MKFFKYLTLMISTTIFSHVHAATKVIINLSDSYTSSTNTSQKITLTKVELLTLLQEANIEKIELIKVPVLSNDVNRISNINNEFDGRINVGSWTETTN